MRKRSDKKRKRREKKVVPPNNSGNPNGSELSEWFGTYRMVREIPNGSGRFGMVQNFLNGSEISEWFGISDSIYGKNLSDFFKIL